MTPDQLRELSKAATPGPWFSYFGSPAKEGSDEDGPTVSRIDEASDTALIVAMRNHFDALLDVAEAARVLLKAADDVDSVADAAGDEDLPGHFVETPFIDDLRDVATELKDALAALEAQP